MAEIRGSESESSMPPVSEGIMKTGLPILLLNVKAGIQGLLGILLQRIWSLGQLPAVGDSWLFVSSGDIFWPYGRGVYS